MKSSIDNTKYPCIMYHEIDFPYKHKFYVSPEAFKTQMKWLKDNGYMPIDLRNGDQKGNILITFDDGHKSNIMAARHLKELGFVAVFYLVKDFSLNNSDYLDESDIKEIAQMGHVLGVHGKDHSWWTKKNAHQLIEELDETAEWIENITGQKPITCSAPGGQIRKREENIIKCHLPYMRYIRSSFHNYNRKGCFSINSKGVGIETSIQEFEKMVRMDSIYYMKAKSKCWLKDRIKDIIYKFKS